MNPRNLRRSLDWLIYLEDDFSLIQTTLSQIYLHFYSASLRNFKIMFFGFKNVDNLSTVVIVQVSIKICFPTFLNFQTNSESSASFSKKNFNLIFHYIRQEVATFEVSRSLKGVKKPIKSSTIFFCLTNKLISPVSLQQEPHGFCPTGK